MGARRHRVDTTLTLNRFNSLAGFLPGHPGAFFASFGQADSDGLLPAFHASALAAFAGTERAAFSSAHGARDAFTCSPAVPATRAGSSGCHVSLLPIRSEARGKVCGREFGGGRLWEGVCRRVGHASKLLKLWQVDCSQDRRVREQAL